MTAPITTIKPRAIDTTGDYVVNSISSTGNVSAGNLKTDNLLYSNGSPYVFTTSAAGSNTQVQFNDGSSFAGDANLTFNKTTGTLTVAYISGNGSSLSSITGANVTGFVPNANISNIAYSVNVANVTGIGNIATINKDGNASNILYGNGVFASAPVTYSDSNVEVYLPNYTGNLSPSHLTIGVANISITGGNANYVLQTDGAGNLTWVDAQSDTTPGDVIVDNFTGDGNTTSFTLSTTPDDIKYVVVNADGVFQLRQAYSISGNTLTFGSAPAAGELIEVSTTIPGTILSATVDLGNISSNIIPTANVTYDLGTPTNRWKDLYLSNSTIHLGDTAFSADANGNIILGNITLDSALGNITPSTFLPFNLTIAPEVLTIQVDAIAAGDNINWLWTWQQSTLPYARATITNSQQASVPLYKKGTYTLNNFAHTLHGNLTQTHDGFFKWIDGAGDDNLISWAGTSTTATVTHPDINGGTATTVQRYTFTVPENITLPTLNAPNVTYDVSVSNGQYYFGPMAGEGYNVNLGPVYRGGTYTFNLDSSLSGHKFYLTTDNGTGFVANTYVGEYTSGVTGSRNDGSTGKTTLTFVVPSNAPDVLFYQSATDASMHGAITIRDLAVEQNINGNYVVYFQHEHEGHKTPIELRPIPSMVNQMCLVYDQTVGRFVPQDMATYVENTPSFKNKIREVAGTATLIAPNGVAVVPTVLVVEDVSYLPLVNNKNGDIAFDAYTDTMYVWDTNAWKSTKPNLSSYATQTFVSNAIANLINSAPAALDTLNELATALGNDASYSTTITNALANKLSTTSFTSTADTWLNTKTIAASTATTVTASSQPNITSVGTLTGLTVSGNITPSANITYNLGNSTNRFKDLYLSGTTIDLAGATIKTDAATGAITLIPQPTVAVPNPTGIVITGSGTITTVATANGVATTSNIANSVSNSTSSSTLTGIKSTGVIDFTGTSNVSLGNIANIKISGGTANYVLKTDGAGNLSWTAQSGGLITYVKEYVWRGGLTENVGTLRHYIHTASTLTGIYAYLGSAGLTQSTVVVKKNGTSINTITIPANSTNVNQAGLTISLAAADYLTVDITQSSSASDLYINFIYQG